MRFVALRSMRVLVVLIVGVGLPVLGFEGMPRLKEWWDREHPRVESSSVLAEKTKPRGALVDSMACTVELPDEVIATLKVTTAVVELAPSPEPLKLDGSLFLNANRLVHVNSRFAGEVVELGKVVVSASELDHSADEHEVPRPVSFGDYVKKGQLLTVIWSKELGEKKSELIESLAQLRTDETKLKRLEELLIKGAVPEATVLEGRRSVESDLIAVAKAERTLRSWRLSTEQIQAIRDEAERVREHKGTWDKELDETWARVEIRAPMEGTVVEKNVAVGDYVGSDLDLFKIADLTRLDVLAHVYEEDLPILETLGPRQRKWTIQLNAEPTAKPLQGNFERIGNIIDPSQHTALVMGWVDNSSGRLRAGQFITAHVNLPADPDEVAIPVSALVDQEGESRVFVQINGEKNRFTCRRVMPTRRRDNLVFITTKPHAIPGKPSMETLKIGERVVVQGGVELAAELETLQTSAQMASSSTTTERNTRSTP